LLEVFKVGLVGCVKTKRDYPAPAKDLYISDLFHKRRAYVERYYDTWVILSAKHHVIMPDQILEPYDETLKKKPRAARRIWAQHVFEQLQRHYPEPRSNVFYFHAGKEYREDLIPHFVRHGYSWEIPLKGLSFGEQKSWYNEHT
jgi:hypothetical protein